MAEVRGRSSAGWDAITGQGWGIYPLIGVVVAFALSAAFFLVARGRHYLRTLSAPLQDAEAQPGYVIDPFLPSGKRTHARVLIDPNNWRADALKKSNVYEVKARFLDDDKTAVQLVVVFDRWTFEHGARVDVDNKLESYRSSEDAMTERYAIYSFYGVKTPCIIDIQFQSGEVTPPDEA